MSALDCAINERALSNPFVDGWHGNEAELLASLPDAVNTFEAAVAAEDFDAAAILIGESASPCEQSLTNDCERAVSRNGSRVG